MSTQVNAQIVEDFLATVGRGDEQGLLALSAEHIWTGNSIHTEGSRKFAAQSFTRPAELGGWDVTELWADAVRLFAVVGLVAAGPAQGS